MAKYKRVDKSVFAFGEDAKDGQRYAYGTTIKTDDINDNLNSSFKTGWGTSENSYPTITDFNGKDFTITSLIAYLYQQGLAEYNENQNYYISSYCSLDGVIYRSLTGTNDAPNIGNNPKLSPNSWKDILEDYAKINGDEKNTFSVASATSNNHAVNFEQLNTKLETNLNKTIELNKALLDSFIAQPFYDFRLRPDCLAFQGSEYKRADYAEFWKYLNTYLSDKLIREEEYQKQISEFGACGFFSLGDGSTTFRMPNFKDVFIKSYSYNSTGQFASDRIQNITGEILGLAHGKWVSASASGVFTIASNYSQGNAVGSGACERLNFDASRVVRTGSTTQPRNITMILQCRVR